MAEVRLDLEQARKRAKDLLRAARAGDEGAIARLGVGGRAARLADAQRVVARDLEFADWAELKHAVEAARATFSERVERFVRDATAGRLRRAEAMLAAHTEIERDRWARLVLGRGWDGDANEVGGPLSWAPLHYVCHSCFATVEPARELLARGADPNAFFANEYGPMSALYGAAGVVHDPERTRVLLEAGADPNGEPQFGDALYHSVEAESPECLRLLLEHGAQPRGSNALGHALDYHRPEHVRLLLDADADANEGCLLVHAVRRGRDPGFLRLLAGHGAELDRRGGEWSTPPDQYRTAYQNAVLRGLDEHAAVLAELGASTEVAREDLAVAAVAKGERPAGGIPAELGPDAQEVLALAALDGRVDLVVDLVGPNFFGHVGGGPPGTLLHHAAWVGDAGVARRLLERGAAPAARSGAPFDTPLAWAVLGSAGWQLDGRDYVAVAELLIAAGADVEPRFLDSAEGPLHDWLRERT